MAVIVFTDREDAGRQLGAALQREPIPHEVLVLGLPRGGVPVAFEVAMALNAPMDVMVVRKLGAPFNPELAVGAIALGGVAIYNDRLLAQLGLSEQDLEPIREREQAELARREQKYRGDRPFPEVKGRAVILVDDGIATGATMEAAVEAIRLLGPSSVIVAVPSASRDSVARLAGAADKVVALSTPEPYVAVGAWFQRFAQVPDEEVQRLLGVAARRDADRRHLESA